MKDPGWLVRIAEYAYAYFPAAFPSSMPFSLREYVVATNNHIALDKRNEYRELPAPLAIR